MTRFILNEVNPKPASNAPSLAPSWFSHWFSRFEGSRQNPKYVIPTHAGLREEEKISWLTHYQAWHHNLKWNPNLKEETPFWYRNKLFSYFAPFPDLFLVATVLCQKLSDTINAHSSTINGEMYIQKRNLCRKYTNAKKYFTSTFRLIFLFSLIASCKNGGKLRICTFW